MAKVPHTRHLHELAQPKQAVSLVKTVAGPYNFQMQFACSQPTQVLELSKGTMLSSTEQAPFPLLMLQAMMNQHFVPLHHHLRLLIDCCLVVHHQLWVARSAPNRQKQLGWSLESNASKGQTKPVRPSNSYSTKALCIIKTIWQVWLSNKVSPTIVKKCYINTASTSHAMKQCHITPSMGCWNPGRPPNKSFRPHRVIENSNQFQHEWWN